MKLIEMYIYMNKQKLMSIIFYECMHYLCTLLVGKTLPLIKVNIATPFHLVNHASNFIEHNILMKIIILLLSFQNPITLHIRCVAYCIPKTL
jgi:hypothetical protein